MQDATKISETELALLEDDAIALHNIARRIEQTVGRGNLSDDIRNVADRVHALLKGR